MGQEIAVHFTRDSSIAQLIGSQIRQTRISIEAALYRLTDPHLADELAEAAERGIKIRLIFDRGKFEETKATRELLNSHRLSFRLLGGRKKEDKGKMHHKFAILDRRLAFTGSYNWTTESEESNFDNLVVLEDGGAVAAFSKEFDLLWSSAEEAE